MATDALLLSRARAFLCFHSEEGSADDVLDKAWRDFFRQEDARLRRFAHAFRVPPGWKEDVVQDVWAEIVKRLRDTDFDSVKHFHCWMRKVVRIKVAYVFRCLGRHSHKSLNTIKMEPEDRRGRASARQERAMQVYVLFQKWLGELQKQSAISHRLMTGRYVAEREIKELIIETGLTAAEIYLRIHRLKKRFREWASSREGADWQMR